MTPNPSSNIESTPSVSEPSSSNPTTAGNIAASSSGYTAATKVKTEKDLRTIAPKVYNAMLQGVATTITGEMQDHDRRFKEIMRKMKSDYES